MPERFTTAKWEWRRMWLGALVAAVAALPFVAWSLRDPVSFHEACREDGPIEWATAAGFFAAAAGFAAGSRRTTGAGPSRVLLVVGALAALVFCGEELSWGQRLLGFETPEPVRAVNQQGEFNVHNVGALQRLKYSLLVFTIAAVGVGLPVLRLVPSARRLFARLRLPVPPAQWLGLFLAALFFVRHAANWLRLAERNDPQEIGELFFALGLAGFGLHAAARPAALLAEAPQPEGC